MASPNQNNSAKCHLFEIVMALSKPLLFFFYKISAYKIITFCMAWFITNQAITLIEASDQYENH